MTAKTNQPAKDFREMHIMESAFQIRLDRLDKMTHELEDRVGRMGKSMGEKISSRIQ